LSRESDKYLSYGITESSLKMDLQSSESSLKMDLVIYYIQWQGDSTPNYVSWRDVILVYSWLNLCNSGKMFVSDGSLHSNIYSNLY